MSNTTKTVLVGAIVVVLLIVGFFTFTKPKGLVGAVSGMLAENYDPYLRTNGGYNSALPIQTSSTLTSTGGSITGSSGTTVTNISAGACYIKAYATTIAASSSATVDCQATALVDQSTGRIGSALTGVVLGDKVIANLSTTTSAITSSGGLEINGVSASTTAGYISINLTNNTGATFTWPVTGNATGTVSYFDFR